MYKLTVLNMTTASIENTDTMLRAALLIELFLLIFAIFETSLLWYLLHYTTQYHRNLSMIVEQLANQYFLSIAARILMIFKQLTISDEHLLFQDELFLFAVWLRNTLLFVAFYFACFTIFERILASIYVQDYEKNQRRWISYLLSAILYFWSITSAQFFIFGNHRELHIILITLFNTTAFLLTFLIERYNIRRYENIRNNGHELYTLSMRTQLAENIKSTLPFKVMCISIASFALLCTSMLHVDEYTTSSVIRNLVYIAFNYSCWSFGAVVPLFMLAYNEQWKKELRRLRAAYCCGGANKVEANLVGKRFTKVNDTFGNNCAIQTSLQTDIYFAQLKSEWDFPK